MRADGGLMADEASAPINLRWLSGTILTAVAGFALMGGAVYAALDSTTRFVGTTDGLAVNVGRPAGERRLSNIARKSDRMSPAQEIWEARQDVRLTLTHRDGDREVVRIRPVTRLVTRLSMSTTDRIAGIPNFNPLAIYAEPDGDSRPEPARNAEADITYVMRDLKDLEIAPADGPQTPAEEVLGVVRELASAQSDMRYAALNAGAPALGIASTYSPLPVPGLGQAPRRNVTVVTRNGGNGAASQDEGVRRIKITAPSSLETVLRDAGAPPADARAVTNAFGSRDGHGVHAMEVGQEVEVLFGRDENQPTLSRPLRVRLFDDGELTHAVALADAGTYVAVDGNDVMTAEVEAQEERGPAARLYESLFETAFRYEVDEDVVAQLVRIIGTDVDFQRRVTASDTLELVFADEEGNPGNSEVLYAAVNLGGEMRRYYRFQPPGADMPDYFDEEGRSARKFLMRKPVATGVMRSGFGMRRHPILGYSKMHTGIDWAAPRGTPIYAAANGTVVKAAWHGGYGRYIRIRHANGYETAYAHQSNFARGIQEGATVRQGQVIGYVGSTGLSTGPHLHYEVLVNSRFVNPTRIRVPREQELDGETLVAFQRERARIDAIIQPNGGQRLASQQQSGG